MRHERRQRSRNGPRRTRTTRCMHCTGHAYAPLKASTQQWPRGFRADADEVWTRSRVEFEGEDWDYVLAMREADLLRAFSNATAEAFGVDGERARCVGEVRYW
ncbi:hypothetical protein TcBrA4_0096650 [Trypanosoma cruzi]|nr:hypothetical protein TcBrA4_0096650 [Trypanosoma cruzi]